MTSSCGTVAVTIWLHQCLLINSSKSEINWPVPDNKTKCDSCFMDFFIYVNIAQYVMKTLQVSIQAPAKIFRYFLPNSKYNNRFNSGNNFQGFVCWVRSLLKSILLNKTFLTWILINNWLCFLSISDASYFLRLPSERISLKSQIYNLIWFLAA